jgi:2-polyprenyl-6-hydroxyphenyl methylase/3-demethylubiquinone-9 3-methyltransferase
VTLPEFHWPTGQATHSHGYLVPKLLELLPAGPARIVDIGCGNGFLAGLLAARGHQVVGLEPSPSGIEQARATHPGVRFERAAVGDDLAAVAGTGFDVAVSTEVIEHLFLPRELLRGAARLLRPGGLLVLSTPYHGYLKNLAIALLDGWDRHANPAADGGHIKFFSPRTLGQLLQECGYQEIRFHHVGRLPWLWKSMIATARRAQE